MRSRPIAEDEWISPEWFKNNRIVPEMVKQKK